MSEAFAAPKNGSPLLSQRRRVGNTAYLDVGAGEAIVFIHGVGLNANAWAPQIEEFAKSHRVIAIDMPGHGESEVPQTPTTLAYYVRQVADLLSALGIASVNIVGHSMGGLVAIGFALAHPAMTMRIAVLNSVYKRDPKMRTAVQARAKEIAKLGSVGNIEVPLERWFGPRPQQPDVAQEVRIWLMAANPLGYAIAYNIFASSDDAFVGRLGELKMPALFATGSLDANSTSSMATAMAEEAGNAQAIIIEGGRHMMSLTHPKAVNDALHGLLQKRPATINPKDLRNAFGSFMTGVTVVTTRDANGNARGFTANSFSSVSLDPPLLLICISKAAASCEVFSEAKTFAVNILAETQKEISGLFASKRADKFANVSWVPSRSGNPLLADTVAWFDCVHDNTIDAGDHLVLIGRVTDYAHTDANPLGYARGGYFSLGLEQSAVNAAAQTGRTEVGAILECDGKLLVIPAPDGTLELPHAGRGGEAGTATRLLASLNARGIAAKLGFLFAVYENHENLTQSIYYRGEATSADPSMLVDFDDLPWEKFRDDATRAMLKRYSSERLEGRYKIYSGDHVSGDIREVGE